MRVSVIIVNYNGAHLLQECLDSLFRQDYTNFEIIVVDNDSKDHSLEVLLQLKERIKIVKLNENLGFTGGNIKGFEVATGDIIVLLNNDTVVAPSWLTHLIKPFFEFPEVGISGSKLIIYGTELIDSVGDGYTTSGRGYKIGEGEPERNFTENYFRFGACAGAVAYRRSMLDEIGFLDKDFFLIHEDTDLNFRAVLSGWKCLIVSTSIVYHKVRSSISSLGDLELYYSLRNSWYVIIKNYPLMLLTRYFHHILLQELGSVIYYCVKMKKYRIYFGALGHTLMKMPSLIKKRIRIQKLRKASMDEISSHFTNVFKREILRDKLAKFIKSNESGDKC